jgi:seryl-tRNA synthetase
MIDINFIVNNPEKFLQAMQKRNVNDINVKKILELYRKRKKIMLKFETLAAEKNKLAKEVGVLAKQGKTKEELKEYVLKGKKISDELASLDDDMQSIQNKLSKKISTIPNILLNDVPFGVDENDNFELKKYGEKPQFDFQPLEHFILGKNTNTLDFESAVKMSGSRFVIMKNECAKLERELRNFMVKICNEFGFSEVYVPFMVNSSAAYNVGQLPKFESDLFKTTDGRYLIPTAETALVNVYADTILKEEQLPIRMCAYSPCFRSEAGSAGKDTTGMIRQHQFTKVEIVSITTPEEAIEEHKRMLECAETILQRLGLHYRVVVLCGGDTGFCSAKTYDLEVWLPGQDKYREICSCSNTTDFQSRRSKIRYEKKNGKKAFPYMLNSSALAIGRTIVALMENYQTSDGKVNFDKIFKLLNI